jgi:murein DD-endopeptidase MepM/ murein hydrolase activator NlpD
MQANAYLSRHGGRLTSVALAGVLAAGATLGAAKADIAPVAPARPSMVSTILSGLARIAAAPPPRADLQSPLAFAEPLPGFTVNSAFGPRRLNDEDRNGRIHEGVDIAAPRGSPIHATCDGEVARTGLSSSYGNFVEIRHADGISSFYAHMSRTAGFEVGAPVHSGDVIGFVGATGHATGPHLHFEIRKDGHHFDPKLFMGHVFTTLASLPLTVVSAPEAIRQHAPEVFRRHTERFARVSYRYHPGYHGGRVHHTYGR